MPRGAGTGADSEVYLEFAETGKRLNEYLNEHYDEQNINPARSDVFMECEQNKAFRIVVTDLIGKKRQPRRDVRSVTSIDGKVLDRHIFASESAGSLVISTITTRVDGQVCTGSLKFAAIDTVDDRSKATILPRETALIGSILVRLYYGTSTVLKGVYEPPIVDELGLVYEKDAKMGSSIKGTAESVGDVAGTRPRRFGLRQFITTDPKPFYEFHIKYCERVVLRRNHPDLFTPEPMPVPQPKPHLSGSVYQPLANKRVRSPSISSTDTSSSSSSSQSSVGSAGKNGGMATVVLALVAEQKAKDEKRRKAKKQKKEKKKAKKQKKRDARKSKREARHARTTIDLTAVSDGEGE